MGPVEVVNQALDMIRARATITSINPSDGSVAGDAANRHYQPRMDSLFRSAHWNFARFQMKLTLLKAARGTPENVDGTFLPLAPQGWLYEYAWPQQPFCLKARQMMPEIPPPDGTLLAGGIPLTTAGGLVTPNDPWQRVNNAFTPAMDLDQAGRQTRVILSNTRRAILIYTARIEDPDMWDSQFLDAAVVNLGAWLVEAVTGSMQLDQLTLGKVRAAVEMARITDGNEGPTSTDHLPDWMQARQGWIGSTLGFAPVPWEPLFLPGLGTI
jgi:hypothetical protein